MRSLVLASCVLLTLAGCGGSDELTLSEYAVQVEDLTTTMYRQLEDVTITDATGFPTVKELQTVYHGVATAYRGLRDGLLTIDPPGEAVELHETSLGIITRLVTAQEAMARRGDEVETADELPALFASPESAAAEAAQDEIIAFCQNAQAQFDAAAERDLVVFDGPWIPVELHDVVQVVFGCGTPGSE